MIQSKVGKYCISCGVQINECKNKGTWSEILLKLILIKYDDNFTDSNMNWIKQVEKIMVKY